MKRTLDELNDEKQKAFYIIEPKRKHLNTSPFPVYSYETPQQLKARHLLYEECVKDISLTIESILQNANNNLFESLLDFVRRQYFNPTSVKCLIKPRQKIPVGYLQLGSNSADNLRIINNFYKMIRLEDIKLITINGKMGITTPKMLIRAIILQLRESGDVIQVESDDEEAEDDDSEDRGKFDLDALREWAAKDRNKNLQLIIVFEQVEALDKSHLNIFLQNIQGFVNVLPIKIIFGLSVNNIGHWLSENINNDIQLGLENYKFHATSNDDIFHDIMKQVVLLGKMVIDDTLMSIIVSRFINSNNSIHALINEFKMSLMIHFYQNGYSRFVSGVKLSDAKVLRNLPSFKRYVEVELHRFKRGEVDKSEIESLLKDDKYVMKKFNSVKSVFGKFKESLNQYVTDIAKETGTDMYQVYSMIILNKYKGSQLQRTIGYEMEFPFSKDDCFSEVFIINLNQYRAKPKLVENYDNLMLSLLRPKLRQTIENGLSDSSLYLNNILTGSEKSPLQPLIIQMYNLYVEAPSTINHYEFFVAFKQSLNRDKILRHLATNVKDANLKQIISECQQEDKNWDKLIFAWFLQICKEFFLMGLVKEKPRGDHFEKTVWKGL